MSEKGTRNLNHYLKAGLALSIQEKSREALAATVSTVSPRSLSLELSGPLSETPFQSGERVWIKYWDEGSVVYRWEAQIVKIHGPENRKVDLSITRQKVTAQRRKSYRVRAHVSLSGTVIDSGDSELIGAKVVDCKTKNVSVAGLAFDTKLPLQVGDKLELNLELPLLRKVECRGMGCALGSSPAKGIQGHHDCERYQLHCSGVPSAGTEGANSTPALLTIPDEPVKVSGLTAAGIMHRLS